MPSTGSNSWRFFEVLERRVFFSAGQFSTNFGSAGIVTGETLGLPAFSDPIPVSNNRLLVPYINGSNQSNIYRLNSVGAIDLTFGINGHLPFDTRRYSLSQVACASDGSIITFSKAKTPVAQGEPYKVYFHRFSADGIADLQFGTSGVKETLFAGPGSALEIVAMWRLSNSGYLLVGGYSTSQTILKIDTNFEFDGRFGTGQGVLPSLGEIYAIRSVSPYPDGRILISYLRKLATSTIPTVARLMPDGRLDKDFRINTDVSLASIGDFVVAPRVNGGYYLATVDESDCVISRYDKYGHLDLHFAENGKFIRTFGTSVSVPRSTIVHTDDSFTGIVMAANYSNITNLADTIVFHLTPTGKFDTHFGTWGITRFNGSSLDRPRNGFLFSDGSVGVHTTRDYGTGFDRSTLLQLEACVLDHKTLNLRLFSDFARSQRRPHDVTDDSILDVFGIPGICQGIC